VSREFSAFVEPPDRPWLRRTYSEYPAHTKPWALPGLADGGSSLGFPGDKVPPYCMMSVEELGTAEAVFEFIEAITPM